MLSGVLAWIRKTSLEHVTSDVNCLLFGEKALQFFSDPIIGTYRIGPSAGRKSRELDGAS